MDHHRKKGKRSQVEPLVDENVENRTEGNTSFELEVLSEKQNNSKALNTFRETAKEASFKKNAIAAIVDAKSKISKWRDYVSTKRLNEKKAEKIKPVLLAQANVAKQQEGPASSPRSTAKSKVNAFRDKDFPAISKDESSSQSNNGGIGLDDIDEESTNNKSINIFGSASKKISTAGNRSLIDYFGKLGRSTNPQEVIDLDFVETLLKSGANINCTDKHGQTLLHEVARTWHIDVARFLLEHKANVNQPDKFGRTPLHVAAAVDYPEMVDLLIAQGADKEARTYGELQTPVHYAARNDACLSLKALIRHKCIYDGVYDYRGRTPLHVAAELDRSESARFLLDLKARVGVSDSKGNKAFSWMITKMPPVAYDALSQYHATDRPNRKQYMYLNLLVQEPSDLSGKSQQPLQVAVSYKQYELLMHRVFTKLIDIMWHKFARWRAYLNFFLNFVYILMWTLLGVLVEYDQRYIYTMPDQWFRIVLSILAVGFTVWQIVEEINDFKKSVNADRKWTKQRKEDIMADMQYCHPRWPEEEAYLRSELDDLDKQGPNYFSDYWNIFDWTCYVFLLVCISTHVADVIHHTESLARAHIDLMAITIILLWVRLMKTARSFSLVGPFIVILSHMFGDLLRFLFLYLEFYLPFVCAFWMIFGGNKTSYATRGQEGARENITVGGFDTIYNAFFSTYRLTLVDEYDFDGMTSVDPVMAQILVGTWLAVSAIICLNLFIALLSDTFQRVYDNAQSNAIMQKAITCLTLWEGMSHNAKKKFLAYIATECSPLKEYYDDDMTTAGEDDLNKATIQIRDQLEELIEKWNYQFETHDSGSLLATTPSVESGMKNKNFVSNVMFEKHMGELRTSVKKIQSKQDNLIQLMSSIQSSLEELKSGGRGGYSGGQGFGEEGSSELSKPRSRSRKKKKKQKEISDMESQIFSGYQPSSSVGEVEVSTPDFMSADIPAVSTYRSGRLEDDDDSKIEHSEA